MGDPIEGKARRRGISRREVFKRTGAVGAALLASPAIALARDDDAKSQTGGLFQHGVASGDPPRDSMTLWTRVSPAGLGLPVLIEDRIARDPAMRRIGR